MFGWAVETLLGHIHSLLHQSLPGMHSFRARYSKAKNELLAKAIKKWAEGREIPWDGSPWLEPLALFASQPAGSSSLFCISGPCFLPHTTNPKQTNLSLSISGHCQALVLWAANPYLSSQLHRPSSPCQTPFLCQCAISLLPFLICLSPKPSIISPFHFTAEVQSKALWNVSISFNGIGIRPNIFVSFRHP